MASRAEFKTRPKPSATVTKTILQRSKLTTLKRPGQKEQPFLTLSAPKNKKSLKNERNISIKKELLRNNGEREGSEGGDDQFFEAKRLEIEKATKALSRAPGARELDANIRFGPDVIYNYVECTPLMLWYHKKISAVDFTSLMEKDSEEIVPMSPRAIDQTESELFRTTKGDTPPMSWSANLTALEEDEFNSEGPLIDNVKLAHSIPMESEGDNKFAITTVKVKDKDGKVEMKERVRVILTETDTVFLITQAGKMILENNAEKFAKTEVNNARYRKLCETILVSVAYVERSSQTFLERERDKSTQAKGVGVIDAGNYCNKYIMLDEFNRVREMEMKKRIKEEEDALMKALTDRTRDELYDENAKDDSESADSDEDETELRIRSTTDWARLEEEEEEEEVEPPNDISDDEFTMASEDEFEVDIQLDALYQLREERETKLKPIILPDITFQVLLLERLISTNRLQARHVEARGFDNPFKKFYNRVTSSKVQASLAFTRATALLETGPKLTRFWSYFANMTKGKEVTCIQPHPTNGNLVAASYGTNSFGSTSEGVVCVWNVKSVNYPERIFTFHTAVTAIAFSKLTSYLLAIGLLDGNLVVYDIRKPHPQPVCSTLKSSDKHFGPIWDIVWLQETEMASTGTVTEVLVTLSDDGYLYRWSSAKGFDPSIMLKIRRSAMKIPGRRERRAVALISQLSACFTICFYPDDYTQYLIGTEEGFIHKATVAYTEQYIGTYIGHSGPVYRIRFSPFAKDIFISCGGDWCIKIWKEDSPNALITLCTGLRTIFDVAWAPTISSVFVCASELFVEVWDLTVNTLEPIIQYRPPFSLGMRKVIFWDYLQALIIGDDDGGMTVYSLRNFPAQPTQLDDQVDNLLEAIIPGYKKRRPKVEDIEEIDDDTEAEGDSLTKLNALSPSQTALIDPDLIHGVDNFIKSGPPVPSITVG